MASACVEDSEDVSADIRFGATRETCGALNRDVSSCGPDVKADGNAQLLAYASSLHCASVSWRKQHFRSRLLPSSKKSLRLLRLQRCAIVALVVVASPASSVGSQVAPMQCVGTAALPTKLGKQQVHVSDVPAMQNGDTIQRPCVELAEGYDGDVDVTCFAGNLTVKTRGCEPHRCLAGSRASRPTMMPNVSTVLETSIDLVSGQYETVSCSDIVSSFQGLALLVCSLGKVVADVTGCHPPFTAPSTVWRFVNVDPVPGSFRIHELGFFTDMGCAEDHRIRGTPITSSAGTLDGFRKENAFDGNNETAWQMQCDGGCEIADSWIGLMLAAPSERVSCITLVQSADACCNSSSVRLDVWDGNGWQIMHTWDISELGEQTGEGSMTRTLRKLQLKVPGKCVLGKPEGIPGVVHDCDGPPVVGLKPGSTCSALCGPGYLGTSTPYVCLNDRSFEGTLPKCLEMAPLVPFIICAACFVCIMFLAHQYNFWCMYKKPRIKPGMIWDAMKGRWLEQDGIDMWEKILHELKMEQSSGGEPVTSKTRKKGDDPPGKDTPVILQDAPSKKADLLDVASLVSPRRGVSPRKREASTAQSSSERARKKGADSSPVGSPRQNSDGGAVSSGYKSSPMVDARVRNKTVVHGLCSICADPDICWTVILCPVCRMADTCHTLGLPTWLTYWKVMLAYTVCPWCFCCFNFYGRFRVRKAFRISLEPHRDCCIHCCCCCCCTPCAVCQEARLADAPGLLAVARKRHHLSIEKTMYSQEADEPPQEEMMP
eukprot:TRINITY_DN17738_c0_g1_i1.p1 TRINITY_DN17738_c0_g1~~TRINITY_DN17738_c0_g1_i1.p1  ORF type:complete len:772 (-),score=90.40 TRINITY_DN17738_c0_g1_i1:23-2338(-)